MGRFQMRLKYVNTFRDRHGRERIYLRRPGCKPIPLPGPLGSPEFFEAYWAGMAAEPGKKPPKSGGAPGTFDRLITEYLASTKFLQTKESTRKGTRGILEGFRAEHGHRRVDQMQQQDVDKIIAAKAHTPAAANNLLKKLRALMNFAIARGYRKDNPTLGIGRFKIGEYHTWSDEQIAQYRARHPLGTIERTAFELALCTGQRRADVARMTWADYDTTDPARHRISVVQQKTGKRLKIKVHSKLREALEAWPKRHVVILTTLWGKPWSLAGFSMRMASSFDEAGLPKECVLHGLRKAAARRLAEADCTTSQIMAITGHKTLEEVERYTRAANQERNADAAMAKLEEHTEAENLQTAGKQFTNRENVQA